MNADPLHLSRHAGFARRLARSLVADPNLADDLVQETWLAVLRRPPRDQRRLRAYLETTLRRAAMGLARGRRRREWRERIVAREEATPSSSDLAASMELHQRVVAALLELPEPTRTAILQRFFEDLAPREIARRSGEPVETIRTRLKRGLAALRSRLDEREGGRKAWAALLLPLGSPATLAPTALAPGTLVAGTGVLLMTMKTVIAIAVVGVIVGALALRALDDERPEAEVARGSASTSPAVQEPAEIAGPGSAGAQEPRALTTAATENEPSGTEAAPPAAARSFLRVVDALTGADLQDVTVLQGLGHSRSAIHPGPWSEANVFASAASSPIELVSDLTSQSWWVHAPGYVWGWVRFEHDTGGQRRLALDPGAADLAIRLEGFAPDLNLYVHVFPAGWTKSHGSLARVRRPEAARLVFRGLAPGKVQVRAELGIWHDGPHELAREEIELFAGITNEVVLDLQEHGRLADPVRLAGRIVLPAAHPDLELDFQIRPTPDAPQRQGDVLYSRQISLARVDGQPRVRRFRSDGVTPGSYAFLATDLQFLERFEVGPQGAPDVLIELPELGEIRARVVDDATGERLSVDKLTWSRGFPEGLHSWTLADVAADPESGEYVFLAPLGRLSLAADWDEYADSSRSVEVTFGSQAVELRTERQPGSWLRLVDGTTTVPHEWSWSIAVEPTVGSAQARRSRIEGGRAWITAAAPGTYVVTLGEIPGFEPVLPQTLEVEHGDPRELVIELRRR